MKMANAAYENVTLGVGLCRLPLEPGLSNLPSHMIKNTLGTCCF